MVQVILNNNTILTLKEATYNNRWTILCDDIDDFKNLWLNEMTKKNLSNVSILINEESVFKIKNLELKGVHASFNANGTVTGYFYLSNGKYIVTEPEPEEETLPEDE